MISFSLRDKLLLAFLAILLCSFALTGALFWFRVQSYTEEFFQTVGYTVDYQHVPSSGFFRQQRSTIGIAFTF